MTRKPKPDWSTTPNAARKSKMVTITLPPETREMLAELQKRHGKIGRSRAIVLAIELAWLHQA